ncbi:uncharacterized protein SPPG_06621 [Spizellomyces punctatus DAOM BR117]|uniref:Major facilitator superfamily (MFS) profile domain-containing protein n=1 Tax=Spizellomyces punctatus (strain DAOM BR117) TaxID=645134 RepID=A0A0L0HBB4_SPIPD|nr:uncharacterized protein SPPG_06621 [Spizellomyces punctatus DAOM BR117]KNC98221.1 hypothetical protein SPPG_06621 [Spizellomyces punctatus DAOM BR117]|eukprot:XP_016606261.1 hypothetical protein SPPG_06621 [Spizellomyces punctatus DAOM BR117]
MSHHSLLSNAAEVPTTEDVDTGLTSSIGRRASSHLIQRNKSKTEVEVGEDDSILKTAPLLQQDTTSVRGYTLKTVHLGAAFCLLFTAFNVAQAYITLLFPSIGTLVLGVIYGFFAIGSLGAPRVGELLGAKWAMCAASLLFVAFIGSLNSGMSRLVLFCSLLVGLGSGVLWINQGIWVSRLSDRTGGTLAGYFTGLFFTICNLNGVFGNLLAIALLQAGLGINIMIWGMFVAGALGSVLLIFADPMKPTTKPEPVPISEQVTAVWNVAKMKKSAVLVPCIWLQGCNLAFVFGRLPELLPTGSSGIAVAEVFLCYGLIQCIFSYVNGIIYDKFGYKPLLRSFLGTGLSAYLILLSLLPTLENSLHQKITSLLEPYLLVGGMLGHLDTTLNTTINLALSRSYKPGSETAAAFGFYRVGFCAAMSAVSLCSGGFSVGWVIVWNLTWTLIAGVVYFRFAGEVQGGSATVEQVLPTMQEPLASEKETVWNNE